MTARAQQVDTASLGGYYGQRRAPVRLWVLLSLLACAANLGCMRRYILVDYEVGARTRGGLDAQFEWASNHIPPAAEAGPPAQIGHRLAIRPPEACLVQLSPSREGPGQGGPPASAPALLGSCHVWIEAFQNALRGFGFSIVPWHALMIAERESGSARAAAARLGADTLVVGGQFDARVGGIQANTPARLRYAHSDHHGRRRAEAPMSLADRDALRELVAQRIDRIGTWDRDRVAYELGVGLSAYDVRSGRERWHWAGRRAWVLGPGHHVRRFLFRGRSGRFRPVAPSPLPGSRDRAGADRGAYAQRLGTRPGWVGSDTATRATITSEEWIGQSSVAGHGEVTRRAQAFAVELARVLAVRAGRAPAQLGDARQSPLAGGDGGRR